MITDAIIPALYLVELEGEAANLEFLLGKNFGIKKIIIGSLDYQSDLSATIAGQRCVEYFLDNPKLDADNAEEEVFYNNDFFPSVKKSEPTEEQIQQEEELIEKFSEENEGQIPILVTKHFDPLGDYVTTRLKVSSTNFSAMLKIAVNPEIYIDKKTQATQLELNRATSEHREITPSVKFH